MELWLSPQEPVCFGGVGHVLVGLTVTFESFHQLLCLFEMDPRVLLALGDEDGLGQVGDAVDRGSGPIHLRVLLGMAEQPEELVTADAIGLLPRGEHVEVPVLGDTADERVFGMDQGGDGQIGAVTGAENCDSIGVDPIQAAEKQAGGDTIAGVAHPAVAMICALELQTV